MAHRSVGRQGDRRRRWPGRRFPRRVRGIVDAAAGDAAAIARSEPPAVARSVPAVQHGGARAGEPGHGDQRLDHADVAPVAALCLPPTLIGAWIGARVYVGVSEQVIVLFNRVDANRRAWREHLSGAAAVPCQSRRRGFSIPARSHSASTIAEKSLPPKPRDRAVLNASRAAAATGIGTFAAFAASMISVRSL